MRTFFKVYFIACFLAFSGLSSEAKPEFNTYCNARFGYCILYPADTMVPQGEPDNGDGQKFLSRDGQATLLVFGSYNVFYLTIRGLFDQHRSFYRDEKITYKVISRDWFVVSGYEAGKVFYQKTTLKDDTVRTFRLEYPSRQQAYYGRVIEKIEKDFRPYEVKWHYEKK